jgi:glutaconate CoA-transferase subunit A
VPAITPDYALLHAPLVDEHGNAWIGRRTSIALMLHASRGALVTYEKRHAGSLFDDPAMAAGTIPAKYITATSHQKGGSWPLNCGPDVPEDREHVARYAAMARTSEGFERYLEELGLAGHGAARTEEAA